MNSKANFGGVARCFAGEQENARAGGMNQTDSDEFALDQAANEAAQNEHARAVWGLDAPVVDPLKEARAILTDALCHNPRHDDACEAQNFAEHNSYLPASHPAWNFQPACTCWVGRLAGWLRNNSEI